jgi:thiaminase
MTSQSDIQNSLEKGMTRLEKTLSEVNWSEIDVYADYLAQTYYYVCHSTRLLAHSASRFLVSDHVWHKRFIQHISEEFNHERLALSDLKAIGRSLAEFPEKPETKAFYLTQYAMNDVNPKAVLGYILILELLAVRKGQWLKERTEIHKTRGQATSFLRLHSNEDEAHVKEAMALCADLSASDREAVIQSIQVSACLMGHWLGSLGKPKGLEFGACAS